MANWMRVGTDVVTGGVTGVMDQVIQNQDDKRAKEKLAAGQKLGIMQQYGTYLNYAAPLLGIASIAMGWLTGDWATRVAVAGSQLAGRRATWHMTKKKEEREGLGYAYSGWRRASEMEAARQAAARGAVGYDNINPQDQLLV